MASKSLSMVVHSFLLFIIGLSVGIISTLYHFNTFSSFPFSVPPSIFSLSTSSLSPPQTPPPPPSNASMKLDDDEQKSLKSHNMTDDELLRLAAASSAVVVKDVAKVAFMFLTPGPLPLAPFWEKFFEGHQHLFSIYIHAHPSYNQSFPETSVFYGRTIPSQVISTVQLYITYIIHLIWWHIDRCIMHACSLCFGELYRWSMQKEDS